MPPRRTPAPQSPTKTIEVVDPSWILKAVGITIFAAVFCAYLTLCLLFYQGQWQLVLHPARPTTPPPSIAQMVHFGAADTGNPQLTGWYFPAPVDGRYATTTLLFLPAGDGSLASYTTTLVDLHSLGINVFAIDYRGYGQSADLHPTQLRLQQDAVTAFDYLTSTRGLQPGQIIPYSTGIGAALAAQLAASRPGIPALIFDAPDGDLLDRVRQDPRSSLVPVRLLFHERFPLASRLATLTPPKLLISYTSTAPNIRAAIQAAADPKMTVELDTAAPAAADRFTPKIEASALTRFLDEYQRGPKPPSPTSPH